MVNYQIIWTHLKILLMIEKVGLKQIHLKECPFDIILKTKSWLHRFYSKNVLIYNRVFTWDFISGSYQSVITIYKKYPESKVIVGIISLQQFWQK